MTKPKRSPAKTRKTAKAKPVKKATPRKRQTTSKLPVRALTLIKQEEKIYDLEHELEVIKDPAGKLTLVASPLINKQLLTILQQTPQEHIKSRPGKGGGQWDYVTGTYVNKVLNHVFAWMWDFQILEQGREGDSIWVKGRLTIKNKLGETIIIKEQFGGADIKFKRNSKNMLDYANDLKSAATDAKKKCASELGIASDIYGKEEFKQVAEEIRKPVPQKVAVNVDVKDKQMNMLKSKLFKLGATNEKQALTILNEKTGLVWKDFKYKSPFCVQNALAKLLEATN